MTPLPNSLKKTRIGAAINKNRMLKSAIKSFYKIAMFPFTRKGVNINIGGVGAYILDYNFALRDYESFGDKHNAGFVKWLACCRGKHTVFDIGAHIGLYTIPASKTIAQGGRVYAFEPGAANRKYLARHLKYNNINNAVIIPYLVGEESRKERVFYENRRTDPMNSIWPKKDISLYEKVFREQVSLDDFVRQNRIPPEVIKIDVEGAEYYVLKGASEVIDRYSPVIFLSVHPRQLNLFGYSCADVLNLITSLKYTVYNCGGAKVSELNFGEHILCKEDKELKNA